MNRAHLAAAAEESRGAGRTRAEAVGQLVLSGAAALLALPVVLLIALVMALVSGTPVFAWSRRVTPEGTRSTTARFRTMTEPRDALGRLRTDEARLTTCGLILVKCGLHRLPNLLLAPASAAGALSR